MAIDTSSIQVFTDAELLAAVRQAKMNILLGGQSYTINGRMFTRPDLFRLDALEKELADKVESVEGAGTTAIARFSRLN